MKYTINNLKEFMVFLEDHCREFEDVIFRGQQKEWPLLPKLARLKFKQEGSVLAAETRMLNSLKSRSLPFLDFGPETDWEWLSIAQHHGMATRLLDWTTNPLAALWFAVKQPANDSSNGVVWVFPPRKDDHVSDPIAMSPFDIGRTLAFQPKHIARRIVAQHGWFTAHPFIESKSRFIPMEQNKLYRKILSKLVIPPESFSELRFGLDRCGINAATLYGDLDGLCQDLEWQESLLADEVDVD